MARALSRSTPAASVRVVLIRAFTLVELLVVIAIIAILIGLLLPAVQQAREAGRRTQCGNSLKQLGLAVLQYENAREALPPSSTWDTAGGAAIQQGNVSKFGPNWVCLVLPYLEQQALYDAIGTNYLSSSACASVRGTTLSVMLCPSDSYNRVKYNGSASPVSTQLGDGWARGNYGANATLGQMNDAFCVAYGVANTCSAGATSTGWQSRWTRGVMGANSSVPLARIDDGLASTILLGETRSGLYNCDPRGVWALSGSPSALWGHGSALLDGAGPNATHTGADNVSTCNTIVSAAGCTDWANCPALIKQNMTCYVGPFVWNNQVRVNSMHFGGAQVCFADGSVHWISDFIDAKSNFNTNPPTLAPWDALNLSADGMPLNSAAY